MIVPIRFRVPAAQADRFRIDAEDALAALAERPGFVNGRLAVNVDDPELWTLITLWRDTGSYRRAIGSYEVKLRTPLLSRGLDEPSAYEVAVNVDGRGD